MWLPPVIALLLLSLVACGAEQQPGPPITSKRLTELAQKAKAEGKRSISTSVNIELDTGSTLRDVLQRASIVIARPAGKSRVQVDGDGITTAQDFRVERWLLRAPAAVGRCSQPWPGVADDESLVTTRVGKGTVVVDGVSITEETQGAIDFSAGQRYLLVVLDCPGRRIELAYSFNSIFKVSRDGQIVPAYNVPHPFVEELAELKTISALEKRIEAAQAKPQ
jgi:hypothetical protein